MTKLVNRAKMTTATTGTGTITLGSAVDGFQTYASAGVVNGDAVRTVIEDGLNWEISTGVYSSTGPSLTRVLVESSTGSLLNLSGNAVVFLTATAEDLQFAADMDQGVATTDGVAFASVQLTGGTGTQGTLSWNVDEETVDLVENGTTLQIGQQVVWNVRNNTASPIAKGTVVMATGTIGLSGRITIAPMDGTNPANAKFLLGLAAETIAADTDGKVTDFGKIRGIDTSAFAEGDVLYVSTTTAGALTATEPTTGLNIPVAFVVVDSASVGALAVRVTTFDVNAFATAAQGDLADSAVQPGDNISTLNNDAGYTTNVGDITGVTAGAGLTGGGASGSVTLSHADTSSQASVNNSGRTFIQDITLDTYGHITAIVSATDADTFVGTVTSVNLTAGTGVSVSGGPITSSGSITVTNTAPDQVVSLTGGANVTITGTYPSFTIAATDTNTTYSAGALLDLNGTTFDVDLSELTDMTATMVGTDEFVVLDSGAQRRKAANEIGLSIFSNDAGFTTNVGDITAVAAGAGLTGGGTSGDVTLSHADTSSQASVNNSGRTYIQDVTLDTYGHVTGLVSATETVVNTTSLPIENSAGTAQFTATNTTGLQFAAAGASSVAFDAVNQRVTISSTDTNTTYSAGNGIGLSGTTFSVAAGGGLAQDASGLSHADTSSQASVNNSGRTYIQDITLDTYGHVTALVSATETVVNTTSLPIENSAGTAQFTATNTTGLQFAASGASSVAFDAVNQRVTISSTDTNTTYSAGNGIGLSGTTFSVAAGGGLTQNASGLSHADTSSQASLTALTGANVVSDIDVDTYGHVTLLATRAMTAADIGAITGNQTITLSGDLSGSGTTSINAQIVANAVGANELNVSGNGTAGQFLQSDGDGSFTWAAPSGVPTGGIIMWSGLVANIPAGWALCDGANGTPNLTDRFIVGAGDSYAVGATGGADTVTLSIANLPGHTHSVSGTTASDGAHTHNVSGNTSNTGGHTHSGSTSNTGAHTHNVRGSLSVGGTYPYTLRNAGNQGVTTSAGAHSHNFNTNTAGAHSHTLSGTADSAGAHTHTFSATTGSTGSGTAHENRPLYYALALIMKT